MTNVVADEVLGRFARQQHDWFERVRKGSLDPEEVACAVQCIIDRGSAILASPFKYDKRKDGWELLEDVEFTPIDPAKLEPVPFIKTGEGFINGDEMLRRAREELRVNLGQRHAEYLLERQKEIPKEFRKYYIVFTGTVWRYQGSHCCVACLFWYGEGWVLDFRWFGGGWGSGARLARLREYLEF